MATNSTDPSPKADNTALWSHKPGEPHPVYDNDQYIQQAGIIGAMSKQIDTLMQELTVMFPPPEGKAWVIMGDHRPYVRTLADAE